MEFNENALGSAITDQLRDGAACAELAELEAAGLRRRLPAGLEVEADGVHGRLEGRPVRLFCGNDYLGLAGHPAVAQAACQAIREWGWGAGAARLICGQRRPHEQLETALANFKGTPAAVSLPTGYQANLATVVALAGPDDAVFVDKLNHASLVDAARLSGARLRVYEHNNTQRLADLLAQSLTGQTSTGRPTRRRVIVTDGVFSMDGDVARLVELAGLARQYQAWLIVDEAHGTGTLGTTGRGAAQYAGLQPQDVTATVGTLSKSLGGIGGFVTGSRAIVDLVINKGRAGLFTTAAPPAAAAAALAALELIDSEPQRRQRLANHARALRNGLAAILAAHPLGPLRSLSGPDWPEESPIIVIITGTAESALTGAAFLRQRGFVVPAIRPPTVPVGQARLRLTVSANHEDNDVADLLAALADWFDSLTQNS